MSEITENDVSNPPLPDATPDPAESLDVDVDVDADAELEDMSGAPRGKMRVFLPLGCGVVWDSRDGAEWVAAAGER